MMLLLQLEKQYVVLILQMIFLRIMVEMLIWRSRKGIDLNKLKLQGTYV